jgi:hypothetical protein
MIIAREEGEVKFLEGYRNQYANLYPLSCNGPIALIDGEPNQADLQIAAKILARYSQGRDEAAVDVEIKLTSGIMQTLNVKPFSADEIQKNWMV